MKYSWSVLVCCHNSEGRLEPALRAIAALQRKNGDQVEVVVVDNASTDGTQKVIRSFAFPSGFDVRLILEPRAGLSYARRAAIEAAQGRWLCFVDDDNDLLPDYLIEAERIFSESPDVVFCGGHSIWHPDIVESSLPVFVRYFSKAVAVGRQRSFGAGYLGPGEFLWGAGLCLRAHEAQRLYLNGFEPVLSGRVGKRVMSGEDGELVQLLQLGGSRGYYSERMKLCHRVDPRRFTLAYFSALFLGMGMTAPVLRVYEVAAQQKSCSYSTVKEKKRERMAILSRWQRPLVVFYYFVFGCFFLAGIVKAHWHGVARRAHVQVERLGAISNAAQVKKSTE